MTCRLAKTRWAPVPRLKSRQGRSAINDLEPVKTERQVRGHTGVPLHEDDDPTTRHADRDDGREGLAGLDGCTNPGDRIEGLRPPPDQGSITRRNAFRPLGRHPGPARKLCPLGAIRVPNVLGVGGVERNSAPGKPLGPAPEEVLAGSPAAVLREKLRAQCVLGAICKVRLFDHRFGCAETSHERSKLQVVPGGVDLRLKEGSDHLVLARETGCLHRRSLARTSDMSHYRTRTPGVASDNGGPQRVDRRSVMSDNSRVLRRHPAGYRPQPELRVLETAPTAKARALDLIAEYGAHLERSPLSPATRRSYERQTHAYLTWLSGRGDRAEVALSEQLERDFAVRDYRSELKDRRLSPASLNAALAALDHFYRFRGLGPPAVRREHLEAQAPRALNEQELRAVLRAGERRGKARDRAAIALMALAGLRIAEVAGLDVDDVALSARKGHVLVRRGKGDASRTVPLGADARTLLGAWVAERPEIPTRAMFVTSSGGRLSTRSLDRVVRATGDLAGVSLSAHVLRHTFVTRLVRAGVDVVLVAELAGHRSLETTRRYSLPSEADRQAAVELASVDA